MFALVATVWTMLPPPNKYYIYKLIYNSTFNEGNITIVK